MCRSQTGREVSNNKIVIDDKFLRINAIMVLIPEFVFTVGT